eukprot:jgi/Tetstr1/457221/TSEL_043869.t1
MAVHEMNAELHVGTVIAKTFGTRGSFLGQKLRELMGADSDTDSDAEGIVAGVVDGNPSDDNHGDSGGEGDVGARRRQLYSGADATLMEAALNLCEWRLKHNIKTAAFERLSKLLKKHVLPKDGSELTETWYQMEQCLNSLRHPRPATPRSRKFYYDFNVDGVHMVVMDAAQGKTADDDCETIIAYCGDAHL